MIVDQYGRSMNPMVGVSLLDYYSRKIVEAFSCDNFFAGNRRVEEFRISCGLPAFDLAKANDTVKIRTMTVEAK